MLELNRIIQGDCLEELKKLPDQSINCCVTSPPYYGLRDYGTAKWEGGQLDCDHLPDPGKPRKQTSNVGAVNMQFVDECKKCGAIRADVQLGLEATPEEYVSKMVEVFAEVKRVLRNDGTLWLNLGDSYNGSGGAGGDYNKGGLKEGQPKYKGRNVEFLKSKDLIGIPWMVAFALRDNGWFLRQDIIWHKPNPMPESVTDRCTKAHEYIFLLSKSAKYYYDADAIKTEVIREYDESNGGNLSGKGTHKKNGMFVTDEDRKYPLPKRNIKGYEHRGPGDKTLFGHSGNYDQNGNLIGDGVANKRSVWTVNTMPYSEAHFATFPERLILDCIKAGCPVGGVVLDPFMGAGTTALVARKLDRNYLGIELNPGYIEIANKRLKNQLGMFL